MQRFVSKTIGTLAVSACMLSVAGCEGPDTEGEFNEFSDQVDGYTLGGGGEGEVCEGDGNADLSGSFLVAVLAPTLNPDEGVLLQADITADGDGYDMVFKQLVKDSCGDEGATCTGSPREVTGDPINVDDITIGADGSFSIVLSDVELTADANGPLGLDTTVDVNLIGTVCGDDSFCGEGQIVSPLAGTIVGTFYSERTDDVSQAAIPSPAYNCEDGESEGGGICPADVGADIAGDFLVSVLAPTLNPDEGVLLQAEITADGGGYDMVFNQLVKDSCGDEGASCTGSPRDLTGDPINVDDVTVGADGTFSIVLSDVELTADANGPLGLDTTVDVNLIGAVCGDDSFCGEGQIVSPLAGTIVGTFFAERTAEVTQEAIPNPQYTCD